MIHVNIVEAKARLSRYIRLAESGERVVLCRRDVPAAEIVPIRPGIEPENHLQGFGGTILPMANEEADRSLETRGL